MTITFEEYDKFQRKPFAERLTKAITKFHPFADGAYVLSLNAKFGSGKTTFLQMWQHYLEIEGCKVIFLNAWETDFDEDPIIPIISSLLGGLGKGRNSKKVKTALKGALGATACIGNKFLEQATGIDVYETIKSVEGDLKAADLRKIGDELYKSYDFKLKAYNQLKEALSEYVEALEQKPLIILVDELDRVRPDYSVKFLEAIKHMFSVQGICFVLAVDKAQLEASVRQLYGNIDFENYYRRFITTEASLVNDNNIDLNAFIQQLGNEYFDEKIAGGITFCFDPNKLGYVLEEIGKICRIFSFTPRQIKLLFRVFAHFVAIEDHKGQFARKEWCIATALLIAIKINDEKTYHELGNGKLWGDKLHNYLMTLDYPANNASLKRYTLFLALAFNLRADDAKNDLLTAQMVEKFDDRKISSSENAQAEYNKIIDMLAKSVNDWGDIYNESPFQKIYNNLEKWYSLINN